MPLIFVYLRCFSLFVYFFSPDNIMVKLVNMKIGRFSVCKFKSFDGSYDFYCIYRSGKYYPFGSLESIKSVITFIEKKVLSFSELVFFEKKDFEHYNIKKYD